MTLITNFFRKIFSAAAAAFAVLLAVMMVTSPLVWAQGNVVVAEVDGKPIYLEEVMRLVEHLPEEYQRRPLDSYFDQLVDEVIDTRLATVAALSEGLDTDPVVAEAMERAMHKVLAEAWIGERLYKAVTDETIRAAYETFTADSASLEEVRASHILVADAQTAIDLILDLDDGADFMELAQEYSTGPTGPTGGDLGYFPRGAMVPAFEAAAFDMAIDAYSAEPVQTQFGWHIIKVVDRRTANPPSLEEMQEQLAQNLQRQALIREFEGLRVDVNITRRDFEAVRADALAAQQTDQ